MVLSAYASSVESVSGSMTGTIWVVAAGFVVGLDGAAVGIFGCIGAFSNDRIRGWSKTVWVALSTSDVCVALFAGATRSVCVAAYCFTWATLLWAVCAVEAVRNVGGMLRNSWVEQTVEVVSFHQWWTCSFKEDLSMVS